MILKTFDLAPPQEGDARRTAGYSAERQMAHYLQRDFASDPHLFVLNNLRIVDPEQPEFDGTPGVCQIDHLIMHRWGVFIVESKSVTDEVSIRPDGHGGYQNMPIQVIVAISASGKIRRVNRWKEATEPFCDFVVKADQVGVNIRSEFQRHKAGSNPLKTPPDKYGYWWMPAEDLQRTAEFLVARHTAPVEAQAVKGPPPVSPASPVVPAVQPPKPQLPGSPCCKACKSTDLYAMSGKYGYYWKCRVCAVNTSMPRTCSVCGAVNTKSLPITIAQEGDSYYRKCSACGIDDKVWTQPHR